MAKIKKKSGFQQSASDSADGASQRRPAIVVAGYVRVSTEEQVKTGLGLDDQEHRISAMAAVKGWPEPIWYRDEGLSGASGKRPSFNRLMADIRDGRIQAVITLDISRVARSMKLLLAFMDEVREAECQFVSCKESFDTSTPQGRFVLYLFAAVAELEREQIRQRIVAAVDAHDRRDGERGGVMPYGYRREAVTKRVLVEPREARVVRLIFKLRAQGATLRAIADTLNGKRIPAPRGGRWAHSGVQVVLASGPYYAGAPRGASTLRWPIILEVDHGEALPQPY